MAISVAAAALGALPLRSSVGDFAVSQGAVRPLVLQLLCDERGAAYESVPDYPGRSGVGGLFSQLNYYAQEVFVRLHHGARPMPGWHTNTRLHGYGDAPLSTHFHAVPCGRGSRRSAGLDADAAAFSRDGALAALAAAPRHLVVSHLLAALYRPRATRRELDAARPAGADMPHDGASAGGSPAGGGSIDLAMHVRRGDRLYVDRQAERIREWSEEAIEAEVRKLAPPNGTVLVASDDDAFSRRVAARLRLAGYAVLRDGNEQERFDATNRSVEAALVCDASCVAPLLSLVQRFARARALMVSSKSNLGSFLLSSWFAANGDAMPTLVDLDGVVTESAIAHQHRYFCELPWGSRRGLCRSNQTACDLPHMVQRAFCRGTRTHGGGA